MPSERVAPNDVAAEAAVLSAVFLDPKSLSDAMTVLTPADFYADANRRIYEAMLDLDQADKPIDILTVRSWLSDHDQLSRVGGAPYLARILNEVQAIANVTEYANRVRAKARLRAVIHNARHTAALAEGEVADVQVFVDEAEQRLYELSEDRMGKEPEVLGKLIKASFVNLKERLAKDKSRRAKTGLTQIDRILVGIDPGDCVILAARPGMGKTAMAVNTVALTVARTGKAVLVFSLEMSCVKLVQRMVCAEGRVDSRRMDDDKLEPDEWSRLIVAAQSLKGLPVYVDDQSDSTMATILAKARRIASKVRKLPAPGEDGKHLELGLVVIDYLQFVCVEDGKFRTREEAVASISRDAKRLARRLDVPVLMLAQLNRGVEQRTKKNAQPRLSDLRESGAIEQDADGVIFLHEDDDDPPPPTKPTKMLAIVAKGRHRGTGIAAIGFTKAYVRFDNLEQDEAEDGIF